MDVEFDEIFMAVGQDVESGLAGYLREVPRPMGPLEVEAETLQVQARRRIRGGRSYEAPVPLCRPWPTAAARPGPCISRIRAR